MNTIDKIIRWTAFFVSVAMFFTLLPIILSYSLGYNIDYRAFKIYKTGIIHLRSQPSGAVVYMNGELFGNLTPTRIEDLKPGNYNIEVRKEGYYPWYKELTVRPNMVTKAEDIVLFPLSQAIKKVLNKNVLAFTISDNNYLYCMATSGFWRANMDGTALVRLSPYSDWPKDIKATSFSPDGTKLAYHSDYYIWVIFLRPEKAEAPVKIDEVVKSREPIKQVFWYSQSSHMVFMAGKDINVIELGGAGARNIVNLYRFETEPRDLFYDRANDSVYFTDTGRIPGQKVRSSLYRLDLREKFFDQFMQRFKKELDVRYEKR
jgi:hypothetical protein